MACDFCHQWKSQIFSYHITLTGGIWNVIYTHQDCEIIQKLLGGPWKCGISLLEEIASTPAGGHVAILCTGGAASGQWVSVFLWQQPHIPTFLNCKCLRINMQNMNHFHSLPKFCPSELLSTKSFSLSVGFAAFGDTDELKHVWWLSWLSKWEI